jgi:hypothetical protein
MPFSISNKPSPSEISDAVNYLLANFAQVQAVNPNSGQITTSSYGVVGYLYKYLNVKYADSFDGSVNFSNSPTNRLYYGLRNNDSSVESTLYSDYVWTPVAGGFGTTKFFYYATSGGRQIQTTVATTAPASGWAVDTGAIIDLDIVTFVLSSVTSFSAGTTGFTPNTPTQGAVVLAGTLGVANGGTNGTATPTAYGVSYGTGTAYAFTSAGTTKQALLANTGSAPTWSTLTTGTAILYGDGSGGFSNVTIGSGVSFAGGTLSATGSGGDVVGPASSTDNAVARFDGTTGKILQNSVTTIDDTGNASGILSQQFSNGSAVTLAAGKMWYDGSTGAWNLGMGNGNITQQVGEETFVYGKASAAITDSPLQIIYHTGVVGASGVIQFAPTIAGITDANAIIGIATESLAHNGFGRATVFGVVRGITTNGTAFGETWADDDVIWYNPVTGNPTKVEPVAPYIKVQVGLVIKAGAGGSGSFQVSIARGSKLGGTDSNVQFGTLANNNLIQYSTSLGYWTNVTPSSVTGVGSVANAVTFNNGGAGAASGTTFDGSVARTISYNTIGAQPSGTYVTSVTGTAPVVSSGGTTPAISMAAANGTTNGYLTSTDWTTFNNKGSGTVTSVSFTGGIITVATATTTPALTVAGTSGGIPYFSSGTTWATSAALAASSIVLGGGAGVAPATTTTGTGVVTALGVNTGTAGAFVVNGGALGTPSSGTVTNLTGTASININGTVGATTANTGAFTTLNASGIASFAGTNFSIDANGSLTTQGNTLSSSVSNGAVGINTAPSAGRGLYLVNKAGNAAYEALYVAGIATQTTIMNVVDSSGNVLFNILGAGNVTVGTGNLSISTTGKGITTGSSIPLGFGTNSSTTQATLDTSGNFMVGQTSATGKLSVTGTGSSNTGIFAINGTDTSSTFVWASQAFNSGMTTGQNFVHFIGRAASSLNAGYMGYYYSGTPGATSNLLTFGHYAADNLMNLNGSGNLLVGTTSSLISSSARLSASGVAGIEAVASSTGGLPCVYAWQKSTTGNNNFCIFYTEGTATDRGGIAFNRTAGLVSYNTTSDYRAKEISGPVVGSGALIDSTPVYMGKMKDATQERPMFIAHETPAYAHTGEKDAVDEDGKPVYQQMDASSLIPVMWAELQSLRARVAQLESKA